MWPRRDDIQLSQRLAAEFEVELTRTSRLRDEKTRPRSTTPQQFSPQNLRHTSNTTFTALSLPR